MPSLTEFSKAYKVKPNTIRRWCSEFEEYLSPNANPTKGNQRNFTDQDGQVIALIGEMRADNASYENIHAALTAGERGQWPPMHRYEDDRQSYQEPNSTALVTRLTAELAHTSGELNAVKGERDRLLNSLESERAARVDAENRASHLSGKLEAIEAMKQEQREREADQVQVQSVEPQPRRSVWERLLGRSRISKL